MRTKLTSSNNDDAAKQSTQAEEQRTLTLSTSEREKLSAWLDKTARPFSVATAPLSRKRKRDTQVIQVEDNLFEERLSVQYEVKPKAKWDALRRYKRFTIGNESIGIGECILVKHDEREDARLDVEEQWKARVLEVKALDSEHVYVRVAWLNRPEDLESGRKSYHGRHELIPTNQMDVIDAMTVNGSFAIMHWDDTDEHSLSIAEDQYFWRQTYDCVATRTYSKLYPICVDASPQNPDELIIQCSNEECRMWLHLKCIAEQAVEDAASEQADSTSLKDRKAKASNAGVKAQAEARKGSFHATVHIAGLSGGGADGVVDGETIKLDDGAEETGAADGKAEVSRSEIVITDAAGNQHTQAVRCLKCGHVITDN